MKETDEYKLDFIVNNLRDLLKEQKINNLLLLASNENVPEEIRQHALMQATSGLGYDITQNANYDNNEDKNVIPGILK